jgi:hypothetical protein
VRRIVIIVVATMLLAAACGDDDSGGDSAALVQSLRTQILDTDASSDFAISDDEAQCFAEGLIDELGADRVTEALGQDQDFETFMAGATAQERRAVVEVMFGCVDMESAIASEMQGDISEESARCVAAAMIDSEEFRSAVADGFVAGAQVFENPELVTALLPAMLTCLTADELARIGES